MLTQTDPNDPRVPTLRELAAPIFRHKRAGILTALALFTASAVTVFSLPKQYESEMKILVKRERVDPIMSADPNVTPQGRFEVTEEELNSEVELLKSTDLLQQVAVAAGLVPARTDWAAAAGTEASRDRIGLTRAIDRLRRDLKIAPLRKTAIISVSYRSSDPLRTVRVLDELARLYLEKHLLLHRPAGAYQFFTEQAERFRLELAAAETRLTEFARREQVVSADVEKDTALQKLGDFEASLQEARAALADANRRIAELEAQTTTTPPRQTTQIRTSDNVELIRELKSRILTLEVKHGEMLRKFAPTYPPVIEVEQELAQARTALERTEQAPSTEETTDQNPTHQWLRSELARVRAERAASLARAAALAESVRAYREKARQLDEKAAAQQDLKRARKNAEENYLLYARKQEEARISDALDRTRIANVAVADKAIVPALPSNAGRTWILLLGAILAVMLGTAVIYVLDYMSPYFHTPGDVERALDIPVLASLSARE